MARTVFIRNSAHRKPEFQLTTLLKKDADGMQVCKRIAHSAAAAHVQSFASKRAALLKAGITCNVAAIETSSTEETNFAFIPGKSLESQLHNALHDRNMRQVSAVIDRAFAVIDSLPVVRTNPVKNETYRTVFGDFYNSVTDCIALACIDFNLDNFIEHRGKLTLIDYEWVFDFPVPKQFVKLRVLHHTFMETRAQLMKAQPDLQLVAFDTGLFLPKELYETYRQLFTDVSAYLLTNMKFVNHLQIPQAALVAQPRKRLTTAADFLEETTPYSTKELKLLQHLRRQEQAIASQAQTIADRDKTVGDKDVVIRAKQARIDELQHTLTYRLVQRAEIRLRHLFKS